MMERKPLTTDSVPAPLRQAANNPPYPTESTMSLANGHVTGPAYEQVQSVGNSAPNGAGQRSRASSVSSVDTWNTDPSEPDQEGLPAALRPGPKIPANSTSIPDYNLPNNELQSSAMSWQEVPTTSTIPPYKSQNPYLNIRAATTPPTSDSHPASTLAPSEELAALMIDSPSEQRWPQAPPSHAPPPPPPPSTAPLLPPLPDQNSGSQNSHYSNPWQDDLDREQQRLASPIPSPGPLPAKDKQPLPSPVPFPPLEPLRTPELASPGAEVGTPRTRTKQRNESYSIKQVNWYDASAQNGRGGLRSSPILTQSNNGPCPILALVNALSLSSREGEESAVVDALKAREQITLGLLLDAVFEELVRRNEHNGNELPDIGDLYAFLITLHTGMNVNPAFTRASEEHPGGFEQTREMELYGAFHIPLVHGWITTFGSETYRAFERSAKTFDEALNVQFLEEEFNTKLEAGGLSAEEQQVYEDLSAVKQFLTSYPTQLSDHGLQTVSSWMEPGHIAILFRNDHFCTLYREPTKGTLMTLVTDAGYATHDEIVWESLVDVNGAMTEFFSGDFRPVGTTRPQSAPGSEAPWQTVESKRRRPSGFNRGSFGSPLGSPLAQSRSRSQSEQEDMDLALALQLQEEEEEASRRAAARRQEAHNESLSRQYLDQQSLEAEQRPPQIPPRRSPQPSARQTFNSSSRTDNGDVAPPSYEQAASDPPYREAGSTPQLPRQGNALGALSALGAQRQQSSFGAQNSQLGPPGYGRRPSTRARGSSYASPPILGTFPAGPRNGDSTEERCIVQ